MCDGILQAWMIEIGWHYPQALILIYQTIHFIFYDPIVGAREWIVVNYWEQTIWIDDTLLAQVACFALDAEFAKSYSS